MTDLAKWVLSMGVALALGVLVGRTIEPDAVHVWTVAPPVTPATSAPPVPAEVGE